MRGRTLTTLLFVTILSLLAADMTVGCGSNAYVYGPVSQKFDVNGSKETDRLIEINGQSYSVPNGFYNIVQVGDTVRFNGRQWSIVKRAGVPVQPATSP